MPLIDKKETTKLQFPEEVQEPVGLFYILAKLKSLKMCFLS